MSDWKEQIRVGACSAGVNAGTCEVCQQQGLVLWFYHDGQYESNGLALCQSCVESTFRRGNQSGTKVEPKRNKQQQ